MLGRRSPYRCPVAHRAERRPTGICRGRRSSQVTARVQNENTFPAVRRPAGALPAPAGGSGDRRRDAAVRRHRSPAPHPADNPLLHRRGSRGEPGQQAVRRSRALHGHRGGPADRQRVGRVREQPRRLGRHQRAEGRSREALPGARHVLPQPTDAGRNDRANRRRRQRARRLLLDLRHQPPRQRPAAGRNTGPALPGGLESGAGLDRVQRSDADRPGPDAPPVRGPLQGGARREHRHVRLHRGAAGGQGGHMVQRSEALRGPAFSGAAARVVPGGAQGRTDDRHRVQHEHDHVQDRKRHRTGCRRIPVPERSGHHRRRVPDFPLHRASSERRSRA